MDKDKLSKWADLLLDTGKRNNLINFKDTKSSTVEIVMPNFNTVFSKAENGIVFEVYDPRFEEDEEEVEEQSSFEKKLSKDEYVMLYGNRMKKNGQILAYNPFSNPIRVIKNIGKKAKTAIEETGVNIAYMAFGFINWEEDDNSNYNMHAPVLLVPIAIENESSITPINIKVVDDDIIVNPTFSFKLQTDYGINLPDYEDEGIELYLDKIKKLIFKMKWSIEYTCKIGIFSFLKINMYQDLKNNADVILKNKGVRALLGESEFSDRNIGDKQEEGKNSLIELHNVVDADSSQSEAIELAKEGKSFVLQGPPGTGKSQTITNIIAECLYCGKKVLFVSEKLAALNVVYNKLKNSKLSEFCLELHSHKANKKEFINELCKTLKIQKSCVSERAKQELEERERAQKDLDEYAIELHKVRPIINKTLYNLYEEIAACRDCKDIDFIINDVSKKGNDYLNQVEIMLNRYVAYIPSVGYDYHKNVWYGYINQDCTYKAMLGLKADLNNTIEFCDKLLTIKEKLTVDYGINLCNFNQAYALKDFFNLIKSSDFIVPELLDYSVLLAVKQNLELLEKEAKIIKTQKEILDNFFDEDIFKLNGKDNYKKLSKQYKGLMSRLFGIKYRKMIKEIKLCLKDEDKINYKKALSFMKTLMDYQTADSSFNEHKSKIEKYIGPGFKGIKTDFSKANNEFDILEKVLIVISDFGKLQKLSRREFESNVSNFNVISNEINKCFSCYENSEKRMTLSFDSSIFDTKEIAIESLKDKYENCLKNIDSHDNWCEFIKFLDELSKLNVKEYIDFSITNNICENQITNTYKKAFYSQWVYTILQDSPILNRLSRIPHDETVKLFKSKDELNFDINKAKIKAELSSLRPSLDIVAQGSAISILLREGEKKRKQKNIRKLLSEIPELIQTLKPCFLMSPLSVSTFLSPNMSFDVVLFDEASQIFPQDAIGAIYRGKQLIVVGDSKQMPPSNFFNVMAASEEDDDAEDVTDFESILDLCSTTFPQKRLKWHYRSRYEQLISFSNKNFYENELMTFPSSQKDKKGIGVDYVFVDGVFDRKTKTNQIEAKRIVDLVFENIEKYPERSLGVVAFSISQQNLIDKLIAKRRMADPSKDAFFKSDKTEPFFVKNLETVQGDERDTIIFSVAYAKDAQGKLLLNFGPINRDGGERRLNVAVTRAKYNVQIVSSMHYIDIDLSRTSSEGARLLREYLDYAENGDIALERSLTVNPFDSYDSEFEMEVCDFLREKGFSVDTQVGCSSFRIDLALKNPNTSDYLLAIECDGATYHSSKSARDRDRLRQEILESMGWNFYRIWSTDWFRNKNIEKERLLSAAKKAVENAGVLEKKEEIDEKISFEEIAQTKHFEFPKYIRADEDKTAKKYDYNILNVIMAIINLEAPVSEEWLLKRIAFLFGREKVTSVVKESFNRYMLFCKKYGVFRKDGFIYKKDAEIPMLRVPNGGLTIREIKYISVEELANGMREVLKQSVAIEKEGLFHCIVEELGFSRMGDVIINKLEEALRFLSKEIDVKDGMLSLKCN